MESSAPAALVYKLLTDDLFFQPNALYLSGPFGAGKTTVAIERIKRLLDQERIRGDQILVLVPQRTLGQPYTEALHSSDVPAGAQVQVTTLASLARSSVALYWPLVAEAAGFADPRVEPTFLNLETTQYHMAHFVDAAIQQADFDPIRVPRSRIISQVLDNLNKAALHGFTIDEAYARLENTVPPGEQMIARLNVMQVARRISHEFRALCKQKSLVDYSLQMQTFMNEILENRWCEAHLFRSHRHLVFDNAEEETYAGQKLVGRWLPHLESALIIVDEDGGYRAFLGADPINAEHLADRVAHRARLTCSHVMAPGLERMIDRLRLTLRRPVEERNAGTDADVEGPGPGSDSPIVFPKQSHRFYPQMIEWVVGEIEQLVKREAVAPGQIAVLAPFMSDALRFSLLNRLNEKEVPSASHRPSRPLNSEPVVRTLLTLAALAHPGWRHVPLASDVTLALRNAIDQLDPVRASLLAHAASVGSGLPEGTLPDFEGLRGDVQERVSFATGEIYEQLRAWLTDYRAETGFTPLDQFFARIFGELLSQPGFGFHQRPDAARMADQLARSARNFRWAVGEQTEVTTEPSNSRHIATGREYVRLVESGALGALHLPSWTEAEDAVFIAPAYTFLMRNRTVDIQFWLDIGAQGWGRRIHQPLTHPHVLSRNWEPNRLWTDFDETEYGQDSLYRLLAGLFRRARRRIFLGLSDYGESGMEQSGPLLNLLNRVQAGTGAWTA